MTDRPLTPMAEAMVKLAAALGVEILWPDERQPTPDELRMLPPTHLLERDLTMRKERVAKLAGISSGLGYQAATTLLRVAERQVRWGWIRDDVVMQWSDRCSCFGDGKIVTILAIEGDAVAAGRSAVDAQYCPCLAGDALSASHRKYEQIREAARSEELTVRIFEHGADDFAEYEGVSLNTYRDRLYAYTLPARTAGKRLAAKLDAWVKAEGNPWLVLSGPTGTAKTGLSIALLKMMVLRGQRGLVVREKALLDRIRATYDRQRGSDDPTQSDVLEELRGVPVLLIDDVGAPGSATSDWAQGQLFDILNARYSARRRTILTSNLSSAEGEELADYLGPRIWSRLRERTDGDEWTLTVSEPDLRQRPGGQQR